MYQEGSESIFFYIKKDREVKKKARIRKVGYRIREMNFFSISQQIQVQGRAERSLDHCLTLVCLSVHMSPS